MRRLWRYATAPWTTPRCSSCGLPIMVEYLTPNGVVGSCCVPYPYLVVSDSPVAYYRLGEASGSVAVNEIGWPYGRFYGGDDRHPCWWEYLVAGLVLAYSGRWR